ncbi:MAG: nucleic acid-binding protein [Thermoplasmata archaeon]|nr:nucleic acid-binding protein [Thermoplasmata archaeon]
MKLILDTSALLSGKDFLVSEEYELYTVPSVEEELRKGPSKPELDDWTETERKFEFLMEAGLKIVVPPEAAIAKARAAAKQTGDIKRLSNTDIDVIALAVELERTSEDVLILTDDYSIQNLTAELGLKFKPLTEKGITEKFRWKYKCTGCGREWEEPEDICPICGSKVKTKVAKKQKLD